MSERSRRAWAVVPFIALAIMLLGIQLLGAATRTVVPEQRVHVVATPAEGYAALRADGVRGRIVVLVDERSRVLPRVWMPEFMDSLADDSGAEPPVMEHNFTSALVYAGVARSVHFVPPNGVWQRELDRFTSRPDSLPNGNGARLRFNTVPVVLVKADELPVFREKVVVWIDERVLEGYSRDFISHLTDPAIADVVVRVKAP